MASAVMTHAHTQPTTVDYSTLSPGAQLLFDQLMEKADTSSSATEYEALMTAVIAITGIRRPRYNEIYKCACPCTCPVIFDADAPDTRVIELADSYNLGRLQCPTCADQHPTPDAE
ncbi:hypothetical protein [Streptomyces sp. NPDC088178]|uniref:hypothetical protein n=1 Tax=Streptomyces sp. NPDC088178 TaxID=3365836 RepID=UPI0038009CB4